MVWICVALKLLPGNAGTASSTAFSVFCNTYHNGYCELNQCQWSGKYGVTEFNLFTKTSSRIIQQQEGFPARWFVIIWWRASYILFAYSWIITSEQKHRSELQDHATCININVPDDRPRWDAALVRHSSGIFVMTSSDHVTRCTMNETGSNQYSSYKTKLHNLKYEKQFFLYVFIHDRFYFLHEKLFYQFSFRECIHPQVNTLVIKNKCKPRGKPRP